MIQGLKLVAIDLDGTLLRDDKTYDIKRFNKVVQALQNKGLIFIIISGHDRKEIMAFRESIKINDLYFASHNGNHLTHDNFLISQHLIPYSHLDKILEALEELEKYKIRIDDGQKIHFFTNETIEQIKTLNSDLLKLSVKTDYERFELKNIVPLIQNKLPTLEIILRQSGLIEINAAGNDKGKILNIIQKRHGITKEHSLAIGNQINDLTMLPFVNYFVVVANAPKKMIDLAPFVIGTNENQSVITLLENINLSETIQTIYANKKGSY